ncbi:MAG TPA: hypothetical protein VF226_00010, partial [Hyphomicrobiaceae bacterium]
ELAELERRTEGWAASLQLVEVSLRERHTAEERRAFIQSITATRDSDLFSFLAEEVLDQQEPSVQDFLLVTSILAQVHPELAERLSGSMDGARMLTTLEHRGLFTYRLDTAEDLYRYHGLFRDFLQRRLSADRSEGEIAGLHIHAASFYETHQLWPEAIHHYLRARLQPQAARLIARFGEEVASEGRLGLIDEWLQEISPRVIRDNARLSLLFGEARGIGGDWHAALSALGRARAFFARKGDRRMEALACLKLSTVYANHGDIALAIEAASNGIDLAPEDAAATRLRLSGNLAITSTWMEAPLEDVAKVCQRITVEAKARGWEHFAAIALHNLGAAQRNMGRIGDSIKSLELAAHFWATSPASPFADNAELVASLLCADQLTRASAIAEAAIVRTRPWSRPHAEAQYGKLLVLSYQGRHEEAVEVAQRLLQDPDPLGPTADLVMAHLVESQWLLSQAGSVQLSSAAPSGTLDPRLAPLIAPAQAIASHRASPCAGECLAAIEGLESWDMRGATLTATVGLVKLGRLALEHTSRPNTRRVITSVMRAAEAGILRMLRPWIRLYAPFARSILREPGGADALLLMAEADPEAWRDAVISLLAGRGMSDRARLLQLVTRIASKDTAAALRDIEGADVAAVRRLLVHRHAPRLYVRSFGSMSLHHGAWDGPSATIERRRMRNLLGLLIAYDGSTLTRDVALDILWPDADPGAAINSLNQTVFQLRRTIDPDYRDGESAQYIISTTDVVQLNPELVRTDLREFRALAALVRSDQVSDSRSAGARMIDLVRGEFLAELKYEDWPSHIRTAVHSEVRDALLPLANGVHGFTSDLSVRAACALVELDEFDEQAYVAMAEQLAAAGKRAAARDVLIRFAKRLEAELSEPVPESIATVLATLPQVSPPVQ